MEFKHVIFLLGFLTCVPAGALAASFSARARDVLFLSLIFGTALSHRLSINFFSREWYRGSTVGMEISFVDFLTLALLIGVLVDAWRRRLPLFWPPALLPMLLYLGWSLFSILTNTPMLFGLLELTKLLRGLLVFLAVSFYVREPYHLKLFLFGLLSVLLMQTTVALHDRYILGLHRIGATLGHPNSLSLYVSMITPIAIAASLARIPRWFQLLSLLAAFGGLICVLLTISRTGVVTIAFVSLGAALASQQFHFSSRRLLAIALAFLVALGLFYKAKDTVLSRFQSRSLAMEYSSQGKEGRGVYFRLANEIYRHQPLGVGLNNWSYAVSNTYGRLQGFGYVPYIDAHQVPDQQIPYRSGLDAAQAAPAHNLIALTLGEVGIPGLILFLLLWARWFSLAIPFLWRRSPELPYRLGVGLLFALVAVFMQSGTEWIFRQTNIFFLFHLMLGVLASLVWHHRTTFPSFSRTSS